MRKYKTYLESRSIFKVGESFYNLCENIFSELDKDGFDVNAKMYGDSSVFISIYSEDYGKGKVTLRYSSSIVADEDVILVSDENTNEHDEFYVNSENLIRDIVDWIEGGYFD